MRAAIYTRISLDAADDRLAIGRQEKECRRLAAAREWNVVAVYSDNDVSATRSKRREAYERLVAAVKNKHIDVVVVYAIDRLTRKPIELEEWISIHESTGVLVAHVNGDMRLDTPEGRLMARQLASFARHETDVMSKRLKSKYAQKAERGEPHGYAPYGFRRRVPLDAAGNEVGTIRLDFVDPDQAKVALEVAQRVLDRESLRSIASDLNLRQVPGPRGGLWSSTILKQVLVRPSMAGLRSHRGKVVGPSASEAIFDQDTHERLLALLTDPARRSNLVGPQPKYLLSGVALCGLCGGKMRRQMGRTVISKKTGASKRQPPSYACSSCFRLRCIQQPVDELIRRVVLSYLSDATTREFFALGDTQDARTASQEVDAVRAKLDLLTDQFTSDEISADQFRRGSLSLRQRLKTAEEHLASVTPSTSVAHLLAAGSIEDGWDNSPLAVQRDVVSALMDVTINPSGSGKRFTADRIRVDWKRSTSA